MVRVCVCGGGNAAHVLAATVGGGHSLSIYAGFADEADKFNKGLAENNGEVHLVENGVVTRKGKPTMVSKDPNIVSTAEVVLLPVPSFAHPTIMSEIASHVSPGTVLVALPGQGGFQWTAREHLGSKADTCVIAGINQLPYQCRILDYGKSVDLIGHKEVVALGTVPSTEASRVSQLLQSIIQMTQVTPLSHFLVVTLTPANQVIHPSIM